MKLHHPDFLFVCLLLYVNLLLYLILILFYCKVISLTFLMWLDSFLWNVALLYLFWHLYLLVLLTGTLYFFIFMIVNNLSYPISTLPEHLHSTLLRYAKTT